jgi:hypothetical protein
MDLLSVFGVFGKATHGTISPFSQEMVGRSWLKS